MKFTRILLLGFWLFAISCKKEGNSNHASGSNRVDSLDAFFDLANNDTLPIKQRQIFTEKALSIVSSQRNDSLNRVLYFKVANRYFNIAHLKEYKSITDKIVVNATLTNDTVSLAKAYSYLCDYFIKFNQQDSVYYYTYKAEKLYRKLKDNENLAKILLNKAILQHNYSDYLACEKSCIEMLRILKNYDNAQMENEANNLLGVVYAELEEYDLAKKYYNFGIEVAGNTSIPSNFQLKAVTLNNLGFMYSDLNKFNEAKEQFLIGLKQPNLYNDRPDIFAMITDNLAYADFKLGNMKQLPGKFYEALNIRDSLNFVPGIIINKRHLSEYFAFKKDTSKAITFAEEAYKTAIANKQKRDALLVLRQLSDVNPKESKKYSTEYYKIADSLDTAERKTKNKFARIEYETDELAQDKIQLVEQRKTLIYIALGIILIGVFVFVIRVQAAKNRELRLVQEQQKANEEIYSLMISQQDKVEESRQAEKKRIAQELHDGVLGKLFGTRMNLGVLNTRKDDDGIVQRVGYIDELKSLEQEIREISHDLNSEKTAVFNNFVLMVTNFIETQRTVCQADIEMNMDAAIEWNAVANTAKINLYRILQEAFQNINKHAKAQNVYVTFEKKDSLIQLEVRDDGVGFIYSKKRNGIGLQNMLSRITTSGGMMDIITKPGEGTTLHFELPLT